MNILSFLSGRYEYKIHTRYNSEYVLKRLSEKTNPENFFTTPGKPFKGYFSGNAFWITPFIIASGGILPEFAGIIKDDILLIKVRPSFKYYLLLFIMAAFLTVGITFSLSGKPSGFIFVSSAIGLYLFSMFWFNHKVVNHIKYILEIIGGGELI